jgi:hypothetical protein
MTRPFLAPPVDSVPASECVRCGRPTPPGVSLCEADNPGRISAPSATQVHGTILAGVIIAGVAFLLLAKLLIGTGGPYQATIVGRASVAGGGTEVAIRVTNQGTRDGTPTCRITRDGAPRPDDLAFRTDRIPAGGSVDVSHVLPEPIVGVPAYDSNRITAVCT